MDIQPIRSDEDHRAALAEIEACWGAREGTERGDKLEVLVALVESYEARRWPTGRDVKFDPIDTLQYAIGAWAHPSRACRTPGLALTRFGNSLATPRLDGRDDPQDQWSLENSGGSSRASI